MNFRGVCFRKEEGADSTSQICQSLNLDPSHNFLSDKHSYSLINSLCIIIIVYVCVFVYEYIYHIYYIMYIILCIYIFLYIHYIWKEKEKEIYTDFSKRECIYKKNEKQEEIRKKNRQIKFVKYDVHTTRHKFLIFFFFFV